MHRDAELEGLRADVAGKAADAQLLADLQSQLAARETEIARLQGELSSKVGLPLQVASKVTDHS